MSSEESKKNYLASKSRIRVPDLIQAKRLGEKWVMLTSYDTVSAKIFDNAKIPCLLIGDSAGQMVYGFKSTIPVTMDHLIPLVKAVSSSVKRALIVADLPFGTYEESPEVALRNSIRFMKEAGCHAVKLEGGSEYHDHVKLLTKSGIPVIAHIGFTPQSEHILGGYKIQGKSDEEADKLVNDAKSLESAGAVACVIEMVPSDVSKRVTNILKIPTIGIGAGVDCDAQVLVWNDLVGYSPPKGNDGAGYLASSETSQSNEVTGDKFEYERVPKFVKRYANVSEIIHNAVSKFADDVSRGVYPDTEHSYGPSTS